MGWFLWPLVQYLMLKLESLVLPAVAVAVAMAVAAAMVETVTVAVVVDVAQNYLRLCTHHL